LYLFRLVGSKYYADKQEQDAKLPKAVSKFLVRFSELQPKELFRNMVHLNDLIDSEVYII
jgi:hypothetical protein